MRALIRYVCSPALGSEGGRGGGVLGGGVGGSGGGGGGGSIGGGGGGGASGSSSNSSHHHPSSSSSLKQLPSGGEAGPAEIALKRSVRVYFVFDCQFSSIFQSIRRSPWAHN